MKRMLLLSLVLLNSVLLGCSFFQNFSQTSSPLPFKTMRLSTAGSAMGSQVYEAERTEEGVRLVYSFETEYYSDETSDFEKTRLVMRDSVEDDALYASLCQLLGDCNASSWAGFSKSNSRVLDGSSFSLEIALSDGRKITARGSNAYPKNFSRFEDVYIDLFLYQPISSCELQARGFSIQLPESWLGEVKIHHYIDQLMFFIPADAGDVRLASLDFGRGDYAGQGEDLIPLGILSNGEEELYLSFHVTDAPDNGAVMNHAQQAICDSLREDLEIAAKSLRAFKGYTFQGAD